MAEPILSRRTYAWTFLALLVLTAVTIGASRVDLGALNVVVALAIAGVKAALVLAYFMHLRHSPALVWAVAVGSLYWLGILFLLTLSDYLSRTWLGSP
jgi:cytochrome c oxidase subunit 4